MIKYSLILTIAFSQVHCLIIEDSITAIYYECKGLAGYEGHDAAPEVKAICSDLDSCHIPVTILPNLTASAQRKQVVLANVHNHFCFWGNSRLEVKFKCNEEPNIEKKAIAHNGNDMQLSCGGFGNVQEPRTFTPAHFTEKDMWTTLGYTVASVLILIVKSVGAF